MADSWQQWGSDLAVGATGDLQIANNTELGQQRVLRRLLTNPGDYIWQSNYGAGLAQFIGAPANPLQIQAVIRSQIFKEPTVAQTPEPVINVDLSPEEAIGSIYVSIRYVDSSNGQTQTLAFSVSA